MEKGNIIEFEILAVREGAVMFKDLSVVICGKTIFFIFVSFIIYSF